MSKINLSFFKELNLLKFSSPKMIQLIFDIKVSILIRLDLHEIYMDQQSHPEIFRQDAFLQQQVNNAPASNDNNDFFSDYEEFLLLIIFVVFLIILKHLF